MFPQPLEKTFKIAYARADTLERKTRVIVKAIEYFYPQIINNPKNSTGLAAVRMPEARSPDLTLLLR